MELIKDLSHNGVKVNVTAILMPEQVELATKVLSNETPSIVSVFAGRIANSGIDPTHSMMVSADILKRSGCTAELLWASTREAFSIIRAIECNCQIVTVTPEILKAAIGTFGKDLREVSLDTVKMFKNDAENYKL